MFYSADRIPGLEALAAHKRSASLLNFKLKQEYSELHGFVWERMSLAIVRLNRLLLRGLWGDEACIRKILELLDGMVMELIAPCQG